MTVDIATLGIAVDATPVAKATTEMEKFTSAGDRLAASQEVVRRQTKAMQDAWNAHKNEQKAAAGVSADMEAIMLREALAADKFMVSLQRQTDAIGKTKSQMMELRAAELGVSEGALPMIAKMREAEEAAAAAGHASEGFSLKTQQAKREVGVLAHELSQGNFTGFGQSMIVFARETGLLGVAASGTGVLVGGLVGVIGGLGVAALMGAKQSEELNNQLRLTGNYAGITEGEFNALSHTLADATHTGIGASRDALLSLVSTGKFTSESLSEVAKAAVDFAHLSGQSADDVMKEFAKMADGVTKWAEKHNEQYHFLNVDQYEHIRLLEEEGRKQEAMAETAKLVDAAMRKQAENVGIATAAWRGIKSAASEAWDAMLGIGRKATPEEQIKQITDKITVRHQNFNVGRGGLTADQVARADDLDRQDLVPLFAQKFAGEKAARDKSTKDQIDANAVEASDYLKRTEEKTRGLSLFEQKKEEYLKKVRAYNDGKSNPDDAYSQDKVDAYIAKLKEEYGPKKEPKGRAAPKERDPANSAAALAMQENADMLAQTKQITEEANKLNEAAHTAGLVSDKQYYDAKRHIAENAAELEVAAWQRDIDILANKENRDAVDEQNTQRQMDALQAKINLKGKDLAFEKSLADMQEQVTADQAAYNALLAEEKRIKADLKVGNDGIKKQKAGGTVTDDQALRQSDALYQSMVERLTALRDRMQEVAAQHPFDEKMKQQIAAVNDQLAQSSQLTDQYAQKWDKLGQDGLARFFTDTMMHTKSLKDAFKDMAVTFLGQIVKMESAAAASTLMKSFGGASGIGSAIASLFGGGTVASANGNIFSGGHLVPFANGGAFTNGIVSEPTMFPMAGGKTGVMGEAGIEAVMPLARGADGKLGVQSNGGGSTSVVINNYYNVAADADKSWVQQTVDASSRRTQAQIADRMRRNKNEFSRN